MRMGAAILASAFVCGFSTTAFARDANEMMNCFEGVFHSAVARLAEHKWNSLPRNELACTTQKLGEPGDTIQSLARRGILPSDSRVAEIRTACSNFKASALPGQPAQPNYVLNALAPRTPVRGEVPVVSQPVPPPAPQLPTAEEKINQSELLTELKQRAEKLETDLAVSLSRIAALDGAKAAAELALKQAEQARLDAENANREMQQAGITDKAELEAAIARLRADQAAAGARNTRWESLGYAGIAGLVAIVAALMGSLFMNRYREFKHRAAEPRSMPNALVPQS